MKRKLRVAVLMGGTSAERSVSLATGRQILQALDPERYDALALDSAPGEKIRLDLVEAAGEAATEGPLVSLRDLPAASKDVRPDVVFIALHGPGGEDGSVQGFLETLGVPYTGSGVLASALAMDKLRAKALFNAASIPTPAGIAFFRRERGELRRCGEVVARQIGFPAVVKPNRQGSSFGTTIVHREEEVRKAIEDAFAYDDTALVEEKVEGAEITVAVLGNRNPVALPAVEIVSPGAFFDFEAKYEQGEMGAVEICPARLNREQAEEAAALALECHRALGCWGMSRTDMFATEDGCVVLETNTIPGMTPTSLLPKAAQAAGITFPELIDRLVALALEKKS